MNNSNIENSIDIVVSILKGCKDNTIKKSTNKLAKAINEASCPEQALVMWAQVGLFPESNAYAKLVEDIYPMVKETISQALLGSHESVTATEAATAEAAEAAVVAETEQEIAAAEAAITEAAAAAEAVFWNVRHQSALEKKKEEESAKSPVAPSFERFFLKTPEHHMGSIAAHGIDDIFGSLCSEEEKAKLRKPKEDAKLALAAKSRMSSHDLRLRLRGKN